MRELLFVSPMLEFPGYPTRLEDNVSEYTQEAIMAEHVCHEAECENHELGD